MSLLTVDLSLVSRAQAGDSDAASRLAAQVRPLAERTAHRFFADPGRAEDVAQTALMKAFARVRDVRSPEAFAAWLVSVTRNECLNELAKHRVPQVPLSTLEEEGTALQAPAGGEGDPEEALVRAQLQSLVRQVIATLPRHYRRTLTMRALEDRSYEEIGDELGVPLPVARLWYCRARKRFRQSFVDAMVARRDVPPACQAMGGDIAELIEGTLARPDRDRVQGHLSSCHVCRQTEDELRSTAFRAPARALLLGLGAMTLPRRAARTAIAGTRTAAGTVRAASWSVRIAAGTACTAAVAGVGAPLLATPAVHAVQAHHAASAPAVAHLAAPAAAAAIGGRAAAAATAGGIRAGSVR
ncbi:MAG TPA: sigma-70 family RNA polymerase sigma factor, partial [Candidatus Dormibacteraeota bacterium]|nr:sigma-70 family RNA polymerase sigma factor [Candidatus Dormibacteraeota bacterium]